MHRNFIGPVILGGIKIQVFIVLILIKVKIYLFRVELAGQAYQIPQVL